MPFLFKRGCLFYEGHDIDKIVDKYLISYNDNNMKNCLKKNDFHITILNSNELKDSKINIDEINKLSIDLYDFGIGKITCDDNYCFYIIIYSQIFDNIRNNLPKKDYHITLGHKYNDIHDKSKGIETLIYFDKNDFVQNVKKSLINKIKINEIINYFLIKRIYFEPSLILEISYLYQKNLEIIQQIAYIFQENNYIPGIYFQAKIMQYKKESNENIYDCIIEFIKTNELYEIDDINFRDKLKDLINYSFYHNLNLNKYENYYSYVKGTHNNSYIFNKTTMPRNFSWITNKLCASSLPNKKEYMNVLLECGVTDIITLMENPLDQELINNFQYHHFYVDDRKSPTVEQMENICSIIENSKKSLVHCMGGVGRTACAVICYLIWEQKINKEKAMLLIENRKTILDKSQEEFIDKWWINCNLRPNSGIKIKFPSIIMLVGYPASGKSTFSNALTKIYNDIIRVNQDEIRQKGKCEEIVIKNSGKNNKTILIDRCNLTKEERKRWLQIANNKSSWCIFLNIPLDECKYRISKRKNHPTIKQDEGLKILTSIENILEEPNISEGFEKIISLTTNEEINQLLTDWEVPLPEFIDEDNDIIKFPRTKHLVNLGAATRDDLILNKNHIINFINKEIYVEEKIDGANLGIFIKKNWEIVAQNRSHFVNSSYHTQFKLLDKWLLSKKSDLYQILEPERHILYGEWVYMKHSINYTELPDWFLVFDIYDIYQDKFWSRERLEQKLSSTSLKIVPLITKQTFQKIEEISDLVKQKSQFYDGKVEGVYLRICDDLWLINRAKIVRNDFIGGNKHWSKGILEQNKLNL